jgi:hypothetical protein
MSEMQGEKSGLRFFFSQSQIGWRERAAVLAESHESQNTINGSRSRAAMAAVD